jgi:hypothetical protein
MGSRGATGAEYALVMALVVVTSIGAIDFLTDRASDETRNQADCVSTRPPPPGCQLPPVVPTTTTTTTLPGDPPPPPPDPTDPCNSEVPPAICIEPPTTTTSPLPPPNAATFPAPESNNVGGEWVITQSVTILDSTGAPVPGAVVRFQLKIKNPSPPPTYYPNAEFVECTTDAAGTSSVDFNMSG